MAMSMVSMGVAAQGSTSTASVSTIDSPEIDSSLEEKADEEEFVRAIVRFERIDTDRLATADRDQAVESLQTHAETTQDRFLAWAENEDAVSVQNTFWIANAVSVDIRTDDIDLEQVADHPGVVQVHESYEYEIDEPERDVEPSNEENVTYGLDLHNVTEVHDMGITGEGATVASLDSGIDDEHPDWEDRVTDEKFQTWNEDGEPIDSEPSDSSGHGTHVAGTIAGPEDPDGDVPQYGVAPDADVYHGQVIPGGGGSFEQIAAGMEWAVEEVEADVMGLSLGGGLGEDALIEPTENAYEAGTIVSASNGNYDASVPGYYYSSFASQAVDEDLNPAEFAVYDEIDPEETWGDEAPEWWPDEYLTPDASAAGVSVLSSYDGDYEYLSGTSMSQPHQAGTFALMASAMGDTDNELFQDIVEETAWEVSDEDIYGSGIIDTAAAVQQVAHDQEIAGTVFAADGEGLADATVEVEETGFSASTDDNGTYELLHEEGTWTVTADGFGHEAMTETVELNENETAEQDFELEAALDLEMLADQPDAIEAGDEFTVTVKPAHADTVTVEEVAGYDGDLTLYVDGEEAAFGEPVSLDLDDWSDEVDVTVETEADVPGMIELEHTFEGAGDELTVTTGPTEAFEEFVEIAVIDDTEGYGDDWADTLNDEFAPMYAVEHVDSSEALEDVDAYDSYFVHSLDDDVVDDWFEATDDVGTVYTSQNLGPDSLDDRSEAIDDPDDVTRTTGLTTWHVEEAHPIFDGVAEPGDEVTVHTDTWEDGASFTATDAMVVATQDDGDNGVAVDYDRNDVLLTAVGYGWVEPGDHTDDSLDVLTNAIDYFTEEQEPDVDATMAIEDQNVSSDFPEAVTTLSAESDDHEVAGFQAFIDFDPDDVTIDGVYEQDIGMEYELDNEEGTLSIAGADANGHDDPDLAQIAFNASGLDDGETTSLSLDDESNVNDEMGMQLETYQKDGEIHHHWQKLGDVLGDGEIHSGDAVVVQAYLAGHDIPVEPEKVETYGDVTQDGVVTSADVTGILQYVTEPDHPGFEPKEEAGSEALAG
ncbi:S8 family serine peptidase [Halopiger goleimassiliensis]|uniref:S8 family serine peptidase n=1 Tax=Halopiger goleimassiliensis TaxID=1293048 RepID=UPI001E510C13|nr:S8 family serine peptidase [Halopiger goleimassiliensis]